MRESTFSRDGLGYRMEYPELQTEFRVDRLKSSSEGLKGDVVVYTSWPGAMTYENGLLHMSRENLASASTRKTFGNTLSGKVPTKDKALDWFGLYDEFCTKVMLAEREGLPPERVGMMTGVSDEKLMFDPLVPFESHSILFGDGGLGKSVMAAAVGVSTKTGVEIIPGFRPHVTGEVIYLNYETGPRDIDSRVKAICRGAAMDPVELIHLRGQGRPLAHQVELVARVVSEHGAVLLIVDSIGKAIGTSGDGPIEDAANRFSSALDEIGISALGIDHVPKNGHGDHQPVGKPIGSTMKTNWARATWEIVPNRPADHDGSHLTLYHQKHNTTEKHEPISLRMKWSDDGVMWDLEDIEFAENGLMDYRASSGPSPTTRRMADLLTAHPLRVAEIAKALGTSEATIRNEFKRDRDRGLGLFERTETGDWGLRSTVLRDDATGAT